MPIRITGLNSGLDTESIISALVSSYNYKTQKYKKAQTKISWKQDAWKELNTKIYSLYNSVGNLRFSSAYNMKATTVSDSTKLSVSAATGSINGSYSVQVTSLAKSGYLTGGRLEVGTTGATKLSELGISETEKFTGSGKFSVTAGGKTTDITVDENTTVNDVVKKLKDAGVNASYDATNRRIFVSAKETGKENDFSLTASNAGGANALAALGLSVANANSEANKAQYETLAAYNGLNISDIVTQKNEAKAENAAKNTQNANYRTAIGYANATIAVAEVKAKGSEEDYALLQKLIEKDSLEDVYLDANGELVEKPEDTTGLTKASEKLDELAKTFGLTKEVTKEETDESGNKTSVTETVIDSDAITAFKKNLNIVSATKKQAESDAELQTMLNDVDATVAAGTTETKISDYKAAITANEGTIAANNAVLAENPLITAGMTDAQITAFEEKVAYAVGVVNGTNPVNTYKTANRVDGSDAIIYVNGAEYTGTSNTFAINGMSFTATGVTATDVNGDGKVTKDDIVESNAVNVTVNTDTQGIYDKVKDFLTQYNSIINEMSKLFNADSAKGYEPLTDEEKEAMSDTEVEKWEAKIKESLLRRDDTLSSLINSMSNAMSKGVSVNGKTYYLSNFGIKTLGYFNAPKNEKYAYHIDGDADDVNTSGNADKLMAAITEDPDSVVSFMQGLAKNLYNAVDSKMKSTTLSSTYTVYNDKEMASEYSDYTSLIKKWQERLEQQEEYYYQKFAAMETALSKLNSQTSSLSGFFG